MDVTVIGCGYVGLVTGTCLASIGHTVRGVEKDQAKIKTLAIEYPRSRRMVDVA